MGYAYSIHLNRGLSHFSWHHSIVETSSENISWFKYIMDCWSRIVANGGKEPRGIRGFAIEGGNTIFSSWKLQGNQVRLLWMPSWSIYLFWTGRRSEYAWPFPWVFKWRGPLCWKNWSPSPWIPWLELAEWQPAHRVSRGWDQFLSHYIQLGENFKRKGMLKKTNVTF